MFANCHCVRAIYKTPQLVSFRCFGASSTVCYSADRVVSGIAVVVSTCFVVIGSKYAANRFQVLTSLFDHEHMGIALYLLAALFVVSLFLELYGAHIDYNSRELIDNNAKQTMIF